MNDFRVLGNDGELYSSFIGRDDPLRELDQAMSHGPAGVLIHGLEGVGKTTLARCFARRLLDADRISTDRLFCFSLLWDIRTAEYVINHLGIELLGLEFVLDSMEERIERLAESLRQQRCLIIWDDFEVVYGIQSEEERAKFRSQDQQHLLDLLKKLHGGNTKVLITSRSDESWLGTHDCFRINLGGFEGEERWQYCKKMLSNLGLSTDHKDPQLARLLDQTDGNPMAMRIMLPELKDRSAEELCKALETNLQSLGDVAMASEGKLLATLQYAEQSVPESSRPLLVPLALYERFVDGNDLEAMAAQSGTAQSETATRTRVDALLQALTHAGLLESCGATIYQIHPMLTRYLRRSEVESSDKSWQRAFVEVMASRTNSFPPVKGSEQRIPCYFNDLNYQAALELADHLCMDSQFSRLLYCLITNTQNKRDFDEKVRGYRQTADAKPPAGDPEAEAARFYKLGLITLQQRDFDAAAASFSHALEIAEGMDNENVVATIWHVLGWVAQEQGNLDTAETLCQKALCQYEKLDKERNAMNIYGSLGLIAMKQRHFDVAEQWIQKARAVFEKRSDEFNAAGSYHRLGFLAQTQQDFDAAVEWYEKSLAMNEAIGNEHGKARTYYHLGMVTTERSDFDAAGEWFRKSLEIIMKQGDQYTAPNLYERLGVRAYLKRDFDFAERWSQKALEIAQQQNNQPIMACAHHLLAMITAERGNLEGAETLYGKTLQLFNRKPRFFKQHKKDVSATYHQLGIIAQQENKLDAAEKWYRKALEIDEELGDEHYAAITYINLGVLARQRGDFDTAEKLMQKSLDIKEKQGNEPGMTYAYHNLGRVAEERGDFDTAEKWYRKTIEVYEKHGNELSAAHTYVYLGRIAHARQDTDAAETWYQKAISIFQKHGDPEGVLLLSTIAEERNDFEAAEELCRQALDIAKAQENKRSEERCCHQLGCLAAQQQDYDTAEQWLQKVLEIDKKRGRMDDAARTCYTLGTIAQKHRDFGVADKWLQKFHEINQNATWWNWLIFHVRSWFHKCLGIFSK